LKEIDRGQSSYVAERKNNEHYAQFLAPRNAGSADVVSRMRNVSLRVGYDCFVRHQMACMNRCSSLDILSSIDVPVLVVGGANDKVTPPECQFELAGAIPQATLQIFPECGHVAHWEITEQLNKSIEQFIRNT
jgi:pimeloyl-ACP methyl ester carboxylesterase